MIRIPTSSLQPALVILLARVACAVALLAAVGTAPAKEACDSSDAPGATVPATRRVIHSPYERTGAHEHAVQLHTHTTNSDGRLTPSELMRAHEQAGYAACAVTDHDHAEGAYQPCLQDPGGHRIVHLPGVEYSVGYHLQGIGMNEIYYEGENRRQEQIDRIRADGGIAFWAHTAREDIRGITYEGLARYENYCGLEIFTQNVRPPRYSPHKVDYVLAELGRRIHVFATSDTHRGAQVLAYVRVLSDVPLQELTRDHVMDALRTGRFFSVADRGIAFGEHGSRDQRKDIIPDQAPRLKITTRGEAIHVESDREASLEFITNRHNYYSEGPNGSLAKSGVTSATYRVHPQDEYVRIQAIAADSEARTWSNPLYIEPVAAEAGP